MSFAPALDPLDRKENEASDLTREEYCHPRVVAYRSENVEQPEMLAPAGVH